MQIILSFMMNIELRFKPHLRFELFKLREVPLSHLVYVRNGFPNFFNRCIECSFKHQTILIHIWVFTFNFLQVAFELVNILFQSFIGFESFYYVQKFLFGIKYHLPFQKGLRALLLKLNGSNKMRTRNMFKYNSFILHYFFINRFVLVVFSVRAMHDKIPGATDSYIHFKNRIGETVGPPPIFNVLWFCPYVPDQFNRRVQNTGNNDLPVSSC